uniref:G-protein coupled receptors family 1 profile domain-containing protein n=1 Tax=Acrobeloides nanus TaxID=290746 RepID=A0A914DEM0_9BILA
MSLTSLPVTAITIFTRDWVFPSLFCKLIGVFQGGSVFVSSFTLTAIAVDRYFLIRYPARQTLSYGTAVTIVMLIWIFGYACASPAGILSIIDVYYASDYHQYCGIFCEEKWPDFDGNRMRKTYGTSVLIIQFGLPLLISSICYWMIGRIIREQLEKRKKHQTLLESNQQKLENRKSRSSRMMIAMVGGLVLAWLPMNLVNLYRDYFLDSIHPSYSLIFAGCHVVAMTSAVWNPIIYSWFNPQFRSTLKNAFARNAHMSMRYNAMLLER